MTTTTTRRILAPVEITRQTRTLRGKVQTWEARTLDGSWLLSKLEVPGTPWEPRETVTGLAADWYSTLDDARAAIADGTAAAAIERQLAHKRGEHDAQRDPSCLAC
jgi:hypothetical protein